MGDSITKGAKSTDTNGYRLDLDNTLTAGGSKVTYIGRLRNGNFQNNLHDGWAGRVISQIANLSSPDLPKAPNVVLLHAGTNDLNRDPPKEPYEGAPDRLASLMDEILTGVADTTLLVAQIIMTANDDSNARIADYNAAIPDLVNARVDQGYKILAVDMSSIGGGSSGDLSDDGLHPSDQGYSKIADAWHQGLLQASNNGWITQPA